jgi:uncharacterized protein YqjF (DUF2071 family)
MGAMRVMTQQWRDLLFAHWAFDPDVVRGLLPQHLWDLGVELDLFDNQAYVGLIPFQMQNLRIRGLPPIPSTTNFAEINVRTYVSYQGKPAVWFFSLDTAHLLPTIVARLAFNLPYCYGSASVTVTGHGEGAIYASRVERKWPNRSSSSLAARIGPPIETSPLASFLTARWGLVTTSNSSRNSTFLPSRARSTADSGRTTSPVKKPPTWFGAVDHEPWSLHSATLLDLDDDLVQSAGLPRPEGDPILLYSPGVSTTVYSLERIRPPISR